MVNDAETHREEDKKFQELVTARNQADALTHGARSAIKDNGDKVPGDLIGRVEAADDELQTPMTRDHKDPIKDKYKPSAQAHQELFSAAPPHTQPAGKGREDVEAG